MMMKNVMNISIINRHKLPSQKVNLNISNSPLPRKTYISGHFHLKSLINPENCVCNQLIF